MTEAWYRFTARKRQPCGTCGKQVAPAERNDGAQVEIVLTPCGDGAWMGIGEHSCATEANT